VTLDAALAAGRARLTGVVDSPAADARLLLGAVLERERGWLVAHGDEPLGARAEARFEQLLGERARGTPVAYLTGEAWFYGRRFAITRDVLVPRPESEHLVAAALEFLRGLGERPLRACDVGTGSGILALTLASEVPALSVVGGDVSAAALALAERNARSLGLTGRVRFACGDLLEAVAGEPLFDCLVANLPYVPSADVPGPPDPLAFEPRLALDGGPDGLALYRRLLLRAPAALAPGGALFCEAAPPTAPGLAALVSETFPAATVAVLRDYAGLERVVGAHLG
jgi:release factor glutamine methyltransferase